MRPVKTWFDLETWVLAHYYPHLSVARQRHVRNLFRRYFHAAPWYATPLKGLTSQHIAPWYHEIKARFPQEANHCLALFRVCWRQGQIAGLIPEAMPAPGSLLQKTPVNHRSRFITPDEMPQLLTALQQGPELVRTFILFLLGTACRSGEALTARWEDFNLDQGLWHLPKTKNGESHTVPLSPHIVSLLRALPRTEGGPFPRSKGWFQLQWMALRHTCGLPDVTFHDLRRTRLTWEAAAGMPLPDLQRLANHRCLVSTAPYLRQFGNLAPIRAAMERTTAAMLGPAPSPAPSPLTPTAPVSQKSNREVSSWV